MTICVKPIILKYCLRMENPITSTFHSKPKCLYPSPIVTAFEKKYSKALLYMNHWQLGRDMSTRNINVTHKTNETKDYKFSHKHAIETHYLTACVIFIGDMCLRSIIFSVIHAQWYIVSLQNWLLNFFLRRKGFGSRVKCLWVAFG